MLTCRSLRLREAAKNKTSQRGTPSLVLAECWKTTLRVVIPSPYFVVLAPSPPASLSRSFTQVVVST